MEGGEGGDAARQREELERGEPDGVARVRGGGDGARDGGGDAGVERRRRPRGDGGGASVVGGARGAVVGAEERARGREAQRGDASPRRTSVTASAAARTDGPHVAGTAPGAIGGGVPIGRESEERRRSRSSATTTAAGDSDAGCESFTQEFIVAPRRASARAHRATDDWPNETSARPNYVTTTPLE